MRNLATIIRHARRNSWCFQFWVKKVLLKSVTLGEEIYEVIFDRCFEGEFLGLTILRPIPVVEPYNLVQLNWTMAGSDGGASGLPIPIHVLNWNFLRKLRDISISCQELLFVLNLNFYWLWFCTNASWGWRTCFICFPQCHLDHFIKLCPFVVLACLLIALMNTTHSLPKISAYKPWLLFGHGSLVFQETISNCLCKTICLWFLRSKGHLSVLEFHTEYFQSAYWLTLCWVILMTSPVWWGLFFFLCAVDVSLIIFLEMLLLGTVFEWMLGYFSNIFLLADFGPLGLMWAADHVEIDAFDIVSLFRVIVMLLLHNWLYSAVIHLRVEINCTAITQQT